MGGRVTHNFLDSNSMSCHFSVNPRSKEPPNAYSALEAFRFDSQKSQERYFTALVLNETEASEKEEGDIIKVNDDDDDEDDDDDDDHAEIWIYLTPEKARLLKAVHLVLLFMKTSNVINVC